MEDLRNYDYGDLIEVNEFKESAKDKFFIDYDGYGYPVIGDRVDNTLKIWPSRLSNIPEGTTHILWFNR